MIPILILGTLILGVLNILMALLLEEQLRKVLSIQKKYVILGLRGGLYDPDDLKWAIDQGITIISTDKFYEIGIKETIKIIKDVLEDTFTYFTFDIDGIDPTFAPGTGTPEVGGINVREAQLIIRHLNSLNFIGADVVEVSPPFDVNNMTSLVGATIAFEILCTMTKTN